MYYAAMASIEFGFVYADGVEEMTVGAGVDGGFVNTNELHTIKYDDAMATKDRSKWIQAVEEEYAHMMDHRVIEPTELWHIPAGTRVLSTTWVMKKKANGRYKARITARGGRAARRRTF
jgi:hypothetical protein